MLNLNELYIYMHLQNRTLSIINFDLNLTFSSITNIFILVNFIRPKSFQKKNILIESRIIFTTISPRQFWHAMFNFWNPYISNLQSSCDNELTSRDRYSQMKWRNFNSRFLLSLDKVLYRIIIHLQPPSVHPVRNEQGDLGREKIFSYTPPFLPCEEKRDEKTGSYIARSGRKSYTRTRPGAYSRLRPGLCKTVRFTFFVASFKDLS